MSIELSKSRRSVLFGGSSLLVASMLPRRGTALQTAASQPVLDRELSTIPGNHRDFGPAVEALYPGLQADPHFGLIAPLAILITHRKGPGLRAYAIAWSITTSAGTYTTPLFYYHAPGSAARHKSVSTLGSARMDILQAGDSVLVTPFFNWTPDFYQNDSKPDWEALVSGVEPGDFLASELPTATEVKVGLDGAVFSDWTSIGPDAHHLRRRVNIRRNAEHNEGLAVYKLLQSGASDGDVIDMLTAHGSAKRSNATKPSQRFYEQSRRFQAQVLLRHFQNADRDTFNKALHRLVRQKSTHIKRLTA